jgi:hypothetical protein
MIRQTMVTTRECWVSLRCTQPTRSVLGVGGHVEGGGGETLVGGAHLQTH